MDDNDEDAERPPITEDLRQILEKYPDGGQILKVDLQVFDEGFDQLFFRN